MWVHINLPHFCYHWYSDFIVLTACMLICFSRVQLVATPWTVAHQAPLSMGLSKQEYWSGLPCSSPGDLPDPGVEPPSPESPALAGEFFTTKPSGKPIDSLWVDVKIVFGVLLWVSPNHICNFWWLKILLTVSTAIPCGKRIFLLKNILLGGLQVEFTLHDRWRGRRRVGAEHSGVRVREEVEPGGSTLKETWPGGAFWVKWCPPMNVKPAFLPSSETFGKDDCVH